VKFEILPMDVASSLKKMRRGQSAVVDLSVGCILTATLASTLLSQEDGCGVQPLNGERCGGEGRAPPEMCSFVKWSSSATLEYRLPAHRLQIN
jgi:hypothetical protein